MNICSRDFFNKTPYNPETLEQLWMSTLSDTHEMICGCNHPFAHLFSIIFPIGHSDRDKSINYILARDFKEKCHSTGKGGDAFGNQEETTSKDIKEEHTERDSLAGEDVEDLLNAAAAAAADTR